MYINSSSNSKAVGMADADNPTSKQLERRRQRDIDFLVWVKDASLEELQGELSIHKYGSWQHVAITRRIKMKEVTL